MPIVELLRHLARHLANGFLALSYALWEHLAALRLQHHQQLSLTTLHHIPIRKAWSRHAKIRT